MKPFPEKDKNDLSAEMSANPGYALGQLARAFATSQQHPDAATQTRAVKKVENWIKVFEGMLSGALHVASRTPVAGTPAWATLQVVHGGFVTGDLLAGGALQSHEEELLKRLAIESCAKPKAILNRHYLSDTGIAELQQMVRTGCYRVNVPEEGALLVVAWLLAHDQGEAARKLLDEIGPYLDQLRFYPLPNSQMLTGKSLVHLQTVGQTIRNLQAIKVPKRFQVQKEATQIWAPLYDRAVELFLETLEGPVPSLQTKPDGKPFRGASGQFIISGGWPCRHYPEDWIGHAHTLLEDYRRLRKEHQLCGKPERPGENFTLLRGYLEICIQQPGRLTGRDVGRIRSVLAHIVTRRGLPSSERCWRLRQFQAALVNRPTRIELAKVVIARLANLPQDEGLDTLETALAPVTVEEAGKYRLAIGQPLAGSLESKVRRCLTAPVEVLVERNIITSGEVLAKVIPQITAHVSAANLTDPDLQRLYSAVYQAFRRRRSLLLLNLQHQVKISELPWVEAIETQRQSNLGTQERARQTLAQVVTLAVTAFPYQILPNKLLQEIRSLAEDAGLALPIVDEVAADIFMGAFSEKFLRAAQLAATLLEGSLYERYYGIPYTRVRQINDVQPSRYGGTPTSPAFFQLCSELAGPSRGGSWVAHNGTIIEQEQILTTHNLASLLTALGLANVLQPRFAELAQRCFSWICRRLQQPAPHWKARLQTIKNAAYAWRQMIFFLALESEDSARTFLAWAYNHLEQQRPDFQARFQPAIEGLNQTMNGRRLEVSNTSGQFGQARRFLGWTTETHWFHE